MLPARRILSATEQLNVRYGNRDLRITVSIGIAQWDGQSLGIDPLLHDADNQLYRAKDAGRNRIAPASEDRGGSAALSGADDLHA